ncbi:MAG TPA: 3-deoxy-D-manno-octulosonic acid transferase [Thermoanaerobaculia bacterium]|nr:3-deoxy-D-manno-octulosonic acid transferase [Thermoanaerobaculia bacterium]
MFLLYEALLYLVFLLGLPFFLITGILRGKYISILPQRFGFRLGHASAHDLWVHAVSVGETLAVRPVIERVLQQRPATSLLFTTTTITGQAQARRAYPNATVTYFPFDFTFSVWRFLRHYQPRVHVAVETEIWPNVTRLAGHFGVRMLLANGRISDRSYPRYRAIRFALRKILANYERILVREEIDRDRFVAIGAPPDLVEITGNVKFDYQPDPRPLEVADELNSLIAGRRVAVLASTREGEDEQLIPRIEALGARFFFVVAPRKPERFDSVSALLRRTSLRMLRRSELQRGGSGETDVLLLDSMGELARIYAHAHVAFIGGSLVDTGGHNPIEPAAAGVPVCFGPSMTNFRDIASLLIEGGGAREVRSADEAAEFIEMMLEGPEVAERWGAAGRRVVEGNRGASERTARRILELLP